MASDKNMNLRNLAVQLEANAECVLRTLRISDVSTKYLSWLCDPLVMRFTEQGREEHSIQSIENYVAQKLDSHSDLLLGIFYQNEHIGNIKLSNVDWWHKSAEVSYFIGDLTAQGRGLATDSVRTLTKFACQTLGIRKIIAGYYEGNTASARVLEKAGFEIEGIRRDQRELEGKRVSEVLVGFVCDR